MEETLKQFIDDYFTYFGEKSDIENKEISEKYDSYRTMCSLIIGGKLDQVTFKGDEDDEKRLNIINNTWFNCILKISNVCSYEVTLKHAENINKVLDSQKTK